MRVIKPNKRSSEDAPIDGQPMKKAMVMKVLPTEDQRQRGSDDAVQQQNFSPPPTVIVADMSM